MYDCDEECYIERSINKILSKIISIYNLYLESEDNKYIKELADLFKIKLDESRLNDYKIANIEFSSRDNINISIYDSKYQTTYKSEYSSVAYLAGKFGDNIEYIVETITNKNATLIREYEIDEITPIAEELEIINGNKSIVFEKTNLTQKYNIIDYYFDARVSYNEIRKSLDYGLVNDLIFSNIYLLKKVEDAFYFDWIKKGSEYMARHEHLTCPGDYIYYENGNIIYRIESFYYKDMDHKCNGVFFEKLNELQENLRRIDEYLNCEFLVKSQPMLLDKKVQSALLYKDYDGENKVIKQFEIYKTNDKFIIKFINKYWNQVTHWEENITEYEYPIIGNGPIIANEIRYLVTYLQTIYNSTTDLIFYDELLKYADMLDNKEKLLEEENDILSPKRLINTSFEDILEEIGNNKEKYFALADEQFKEMAYGDKKNAPARVLKQDK